MFVSACPVSGNVHAYPEEAQRRLRRALDEGAVEVLMGAACFHAVVHLDHAGGQHYQTTPARGEKPAGHRSVAFVSEGARTVRVHRENGRWFLHTEDPSRASRERPLPEVPTEIRWEWSAEVALWRAREEDWIPYPPVASDALEAAWERVRASEGDEVVEVCTGQSQKDVHVVADSVFFEQRDAFTGNRRWARRSCRTRAECRRKDAAMASRAMERAGDVCAICTEAFVETPHWPVEATACGHPFHACCLQEGRVRGCASCPLCRAPL